MKKLLILIFLLNILNISLGQNLLNSDTVKIHMTKTFEFNRAQIKYYNRQEIDRDIKTLFTISTYGLYSDTLNTALVEQIDKVTLISSVDVYNFLFNWVMFDSIDETPFHDLPLLPLKGTREFLKPTSKRYPFLNGTQQIFTFGKNNKAIIIFTKYDFTVVKDDGSYIVFYYE